MGLSCVSLASMESRRGERHCYGIAAVRDFAFELKCCRIRTAGRVLAFMAAAFVMIFTRLKKIMGSLDAVVKSTQQCTGCQSQREVEV